MSVQYGIVSYVLTLPHFSQPQAVRVIYSPSDIVSCVQCEFSIAHRVGEIFGSLPRVTDQSPDPMEQLAAELGDELEHKILDRFIEQHGLFEGQPRGVYAVTPVRSQRTLELREAAEETLAALAAGADVVYQAVVFDGELYGRADFVVKQPDTKDTSDPTYAVYDVKLARRVRTSALLQLAAYAKRFRDAGISISNDLHLVLGAVDEHGQQVESLHDLSTVAPVLAEQENKIRTVIGYAVSLNGYVRWGDPHLSPCGRCETCNHYALEHRDLLLVARMSTERRNKLYTSGIHTIDELAALPDSHVVHDPNLRRLRDQAAMQMQTLDLDPATKIVKYSVLDDHVLHSIPARSDGDIFFDFEGQPMWQDPTTGTWGLEYLFGWSEAPIEDNDAEFKYFWADHRADEKAALIKFLDYVHQRRTEHPDMHIYHYAPYEETALKRMVGQYGVGEEALDELLRANVFVDLYRIVRGSLLISENSYSIKRLEPLYMPTGRQADVVKGDQSITQHLRYQTLRDTGHTDEAHTIRNEIIHYNREDCESTLGLREWLLSLGENAPPSDHEPAIPTISNDLEVSPALEALLEHTTQAEQHAEGAALAPIDHAIAMVATAAGYFRREDKNVWWDHFYRLEHPIEQWPTHTDALIMSRATVVHEPGTGPDGWGADGAHLVRTLQVKGTFAAGAALREGSKVNLYYEAAAATDIDSPHVLHYAYSKADSTIDKIDPNDDGTVTVLIREVAAAAKHSHLPIAAVARLAYFNKKSLENAVEQAVQQTHDSLPSFPHGPVFDILLRRPPQLRGGRSLPAVDDADYITALTLAVTQLDQSYVAVQGPPGAGKSYTGGHVAKKLVEVGLTVGVVAQSHAVVENFLHSALKAGLSPELVAKKPASSSEACPDWAHHDDTEFAALAEHGGILIGGTTWTFAAKKAPTIDVLIVDEAGQFSLAYLIAAATKARNVVLFGDPQQLPQVSQGEHPYPIDESALGWISADNAVLPEEFGYFLENTYRMHPDLTLPVSQLSYSGKLHSAPIAATRSLSGSAAGVETVMVNHTGRSTACVEEAIEVLNQVRRHIDLPWDDGNPRRLRGRTTPLTQTDIIVVAAYRAQVAAISDLLSENGFSDVRVGTVDKFQGQEAAIVIVSFAASSAAHVPRGVSFLLNRNRVNVAISRAQWKAIIVRSPHLTTHVPNSPAELEELGAFLRVSPPSMARPSSDVLVNTYKRVSTPDDDTTETTQLSLF